MSSKQRNKGGRPNVLGADSIYVTTKLTRRQFSAINRMGGYIPGRRPSIIRDLLDVGLKVARARIAR